MNKNTFLLTLALAASAVVMTAHESRAAKVCKSALSSSNSIASPTRGLAEANAEVRWGTKVTQTYALKWSNWANADDRKHYCKKTTSVIGANVWRCRARAKPCIYQ